jgi:hypothetical protein
MSEQDKRAEEVWWEAFARWPLQGFVEIISAALAQARREGKREGVEVATLVEDMTPLIEQMEDSLRYIGGVKYLDLCRKMRQVLVAVGGLRGASGAGRGL